MPAAPDRLLSAIDRLRAEGKTLENMVQGLKAHQWKQPTPAPEWTIAHQIAHLAWTDAAALAALEGAEAFEHYRQPAQDDPLGFVDEAAEQGARQQPADLFAQWTMGRELLTEALAQADQSVRYPWFGPGMKVMSMVTARIMETWAHGHDVATALGIQWPASNALQDVAHIGVATRKFTYQNNQMDIPESEMYVELTGPNGQRWTWGDAAAENTVKGSAWDFALLVTQRAELEGLELAIIGDDAQTWASIAQAFAGPPKAEVRARYK